MVFLLSPLIPLRGLESAPARQRSSKLDVALAHSQISPLIPLCVLFLLRTSAIQASLIALGLASVLLSPFFFLIYKGSMFRSSFLRALLVLGIGVALVGYADVALRYIVQALGVLFIIPGLVTAFSGVAKREADEAMPVLPLVAGGGSVLLGVVLLLIPDFFISILLYLLAALLLLGGGIQITQLVLMHREGMKSSWVYYLFPVTIFVVGVYILVYPMETASLPFLFIGYAAILYGVVELLTLMRISYFRRKAQMMAEREAKASVQNETTIVAEAAEMEPTATELPMSSTEEK